MVVCVSLPPGFSLLMPLWHHYMFHLHLTPLYWHLCLASAEFPSFFTLSRLLNLVGTQGLYKNEIHWLVDNVLV